MSGDHNMYSSPVAMPNICYNSEPTQKTLADLYAQWAEGCEDSGDIMSRQVGGNHYKRACQPWEIIEEWELNYWAGNIIKYVLRYPHKNGVEDLEKAKHYLEYLIKKEKDALTTARD
jgi:hypothetical protein